MTKKKKKKVGGNSSYPFMIPDEIEFYQFMTNQQQLQKMNPAAILDDLGICPY